MEFGTLLFETNGSEIMGPLEDQIGFNIVQVMEKSNYQKWMKKMRARAVIKKML